MSRSPEGYSPPLENTSDNPQGGISRRGFIKFAGLAGAGIAATVAGRKLNKSPIAQGMREVAESHLESRTEYQSDTLEIVRTEIEHRTRTFRVLRAFIKGSESGHTTNLALHILDPENAFVEISPNPTLYREDLLSNQDTEGLVGSVTYLSGHYHRDDPNAGENIGFQLPVIDNEHTSYGPQEVVDRFPGYGEDINRASGGITIQEGSLVIVDKHGLQEALNQGDPTMQMVYYLDEQNVDQTLNQTWQHFSLPGPTKKLFDTTLPIGNTTYWWSAYVQAENEDGSWTTAIIVADDKDEMCPIWYIAKIAQEISATGRYKIALADAGNGSTVLGKDADGTFANGVNGFDTHLAPAAITIKPKQ